MSGLVPDAPLPVGLVVAVADNGVIGRGGDLPWRLSSDLAWFKEVTHGKPIVMGRRTWASIGRPLPGRATVVVSRTMMRAPHPEVMLAGDVAEALVLAGHAAPRLPEPRVPPREACIVGGGVLYREAFGRAERLYVTRVHAEPEGDTIFALPPREGFEIETLRRIEPGPRDDHAATIEVWTRR